MEIAKLFADPTRRWIPAAPADESSLAKLASLASPRLPEEYLDLLRLSDGGEGPLALPPLCLVLYGAAFVIELNSSKVQQTNYPGHFVIGSNGGLETIAFELRRGAPWPVVMYDPVAGLESAVVIAPDFQSFAEAIGFEYSGR